MRFSIIALATHYALLGSGVAVADSSSCGDPPPVANEALKGDIEGEAQFLSRFLGDASLAGRIETSREEIFSKYPNQHERSDAYFEYMICTVIMSDDNAMSSQEKLDHIIRIRQQFYAERSGSVNVERSNSVIIGNQNTMTNQR
jgi:hypothetical protein